MADKCTNMANKEQFTICIRWVGENMQEHEGLYEMAKIDSDSLVRAIKDTSQDEHSTNCRRQYDDGASKMSGSRNGVATQIAREENQALYIHCFGHALSLAVADSVKQSKVC